jgi:hypothetical protein
MRHIKPFPTFDKDDRKDLALKIRAAIEYRQPPAWHGKPEDKPAWMEHPCMIHLGKWEDGKGFHKIKFKGHSLYVHRAMWVLEKGQDVPERHVLDHKCRVRRCCNPQHLEPVTTRENTARGNGAWVYAQGALNSEAPVLAASIEHGDPRFTLKGIEPPTPVEPLRNAAVTGRFNHMKMNPPLPVTLPEDPDGKQRDVLVHGVSQPAHFPRRVKLFFKHFLDRLAGVP